MDVYTLPSEELDIQSDTIPIVSLFYDYHTLREDAITANLLAWQNNQLIDVVDRSESPYVQKQLFAASALRNRLPSGIYTFDLPSSLFFTNKLEEINSITIDFDDEMGYRPVTANQAFVVDYSASGDKDVKIQITLQNGTYAYAHFSMVIFENSAAKTISNGEVDVILPVPATSLHSGGQLHIFFNCDEKLTKPLIIMDGLDPDAREDLGRTEEDLRTVDFVVDLLDFNDPVSNKSLWQLVEEEGYDLIFLDYNNGSDDIKRNARMFQDAIAIINAEKATNGSTQENIIAAPSMAGPVSKYGLLEMEQNGIDHETKKLLLLDGAMRGVNVPLGIQHAIRHLHELQGPWGTNIRNAWPGIRHARNILEEPAFKQMFLAHAWSADGVSARTDNATFYSELASLGSPQFFEYVALSAGSINGVGQLFGPGASLINYSGNIEDFITTAANLLPLNTDNLFALGAGGLILAGTELDINIRALPASGSATIYSGVYKIEILGALFTFSAQGVSVSGTLPLDSSPGGIVGLNRASVPLNTSELVFNTYCLVPTASSLDIAITASSLAADNVGATPNTQLKRFSGSVNTSITPPTYGGVAQANQEHNPIVNNSNVAYLIFEILSINPLADANGIIIDRLYNFGDSGEDFNSSSAVGGKTKDRIDEDLTCSGSDGGIWVNLNDRIAFIDVSENPFNSYPSNFNLYISGDIDCSDEDEEVWVEFNSGAKFLIGEWQENIENSANVYIQDKAHVAIKTNSLAEIRHNSSLVVEKGGTLTIYEDGQLFAEFGGKIIVQKGGTLTLKTGGILRLSQYSQLEIQPGGTLIIEDEAKVQLWDGDSTDGRAVIEVKGLLQVDDEFEFTGNGYFDFFPSYELALPAGHFKLEGEGQETRFIHLQQGTQVDFEGNQLRLTEGRVSYEDNSAIKVGTGGRVILTATKHTGSDRATGITAEGVDRFRAIGSIFEGLETGIEIYSFADPGTIVHSMLNKSRFTNCETGLLVDGSDQMYIIESRFDGGVHAMLFNKLGSARLRNSEVLNYADPTPSSIEDWGAIELRDVPEFDMSGGIIHDNDVGIFAPEWNEEGDLNQSNIFLRNKATVSNHGDYGIFMAKGGTDDNGLDYGLVLMDCAKLLDNTVGIAGRDVLLQIDAIDNSGTDISEKLRSNHFKNPQFGDLFAICYDERDDIMEVSARGNYWFDDDIETNIQNLHLIQNAHTPTGCAGYYPSVTIDVSSFVSAPNESCPKKTVEDPDPPNGCDLVKEDGSILGSSVERFGLGSEDGDTYQTTAHYYYDAYSELVSALDEDDSTAAARDRFLKMAEVSAIERNQADAKCQKNVDVARILVVKNYDKPAGDSKNRLNSEHPSSSSGIQSLWMNVYPNPSNGLVWLNVKQATGYLEVYNSLGQPLSIIQLTNQRIKLDFSPYESGLFYVKWKSTKGELLTTQRIIHQK